MNLRIRKLRARLLICLKFVFPIIVFHVVEIMIIFIFEESDTLYELHECYLDELPGTISTNWSSNAGHEYLEDVLLSDIKPIPGRAIYFLETKCYSLNSQSHYLINLTARQTCSIESAALHNPNFQVFVLFANPKVIDPENPFLNIIRSYSNVHLRQLNIWRYVKDTPVEDWIVRDNKFISRFPTEHTSDLLRLLTVYRFGGIYMDMDVVVLRSMEDIPLNFMGAQITNVISNAVISLEPTGIGHEVGELFLREFQQTFNGTYYLFNGPMLIERVLAKICGTKSVIEMINNRERCHGVRLFDASAFFILQKLIYLFDPRMLNDGIEKTKNSYLIHLWNKGSQKCKLVGPSSTYGRYAAQNCPKTYAAAGHLF
ncbi:lactosylceramide 4-alpha-galactosyltransferase-like [Drosophila sulfurigaster albostrigata]|uniref:lactosylceramide 4-alpha-galactosyltransferase-like n=1 Tax=Drosophila sulfurigaster albostrigata TaxID=89887 RepID=UPI002D21C3E6|nr:lactosylceramide 4-alpha-galactosyltransferase-like [Drosophila sulfurigaster albostrigata]